MFYHQQEVDLEDMYSFFPFGSKLRLLWRLGQMHLNSCRLGIYKIRGEG